MRVAARLLALWLLAVAAPAPAPAETTVGDLTLSCAFTRETAPTAKVGAGYLVIRNKGATADRLVSASADFAGRTEIHTMAMSDGVMMMRELEDGLEIPPGATVTLKPGGEHVMFMALGAPIARDGRYVATLVFERAGAVTVTFDVMSAGAAKHDACEVS